MSYKKFRIADESFDNDSSAKTAIPFPRERAADDLRWYLTNLEGTSLGIEAKVIWIYDLPVGYMPKVTAVFENFRCYISIEDRPRILSPKSGIDPSNPELISLKQWIVLNKDALLKLWLGEISSYEFFESMKPLS